MEPKKDLRIVKTEKNIKASFIQLINEKSFDSLTVQDILDRALINRSTFYKHYTDKYNLAETIAQNFIVEYRALVNFVIIKREIFGDLLNVDEKDNVLEKLYASKLTILGLWKIHTDEIHVYDDMHTILKQRYLELTTSDAKQNADVEYESYICASILLSTLKFVLEGHRIYSAHEIMEGLGNLLNTLGVSKHTVHN